MARKKSDDETGLSADGSQPVSGTNDKAPKRGRGRGTVGREAIIHATRELLREVRPASLSRKSVAEASGVDPALVRYYFSDLRHLLTEVLRVLVQDYRAGFDNLDLDPDKPSDALKKRIVHIVTFLAREQSFHDLFIEQIVNGNDEWAKDTRDNFTDGYFGSMQGLIEKGRAAGDYRDDFDPRFVYIAMIGAAHFLATARPIFARLFGQNLSPSDLSAEYAEFLSTLILAGIAKKE